MSEMRDRTMQALLESIAKETQNLITQCGCIKDNERVAWKFTSIVETLICTLIRSEGYENLNDPHTREIEVVCGECKGVYRLCGVYPDICNHQCGHSNKYCGLGEECEDTFYCEWCVDGSNTVTETLGHKCGECEDKCFNKDCPSGLNRLGTCRKVCNDRILCPTCSGSGFIPVTRKQVLDEVEYRITNCLGVDNLSKCNGGKKANVCDYHKDCRIVKPYLNGLLCEWRVL